MSTIIIIIIVVGRLVEEDIIESVFIFTGKERNPIEENVAEKCFHKTDAYKQQ